MISARITTIMQRILLRVLTSKSRSPTWTTNSVSYFHKHRSIRQTCRKARTAFTHCNQQPTEYSNNSCLQMKFTSSIFFRAGIMYLTKHLICTICSSHRNDHRTSSIDCDLHKLMNTILCQLRNLKDLLSLSPLITINYILSGVLSMIAFYLTFCVAFLLHRIVLYSVCMYRIVTIQPFGCNTTIKFQLSIIAVMEYCGTVLRLPVIYWKFKIQFRHLLFNFSFLFIFRFVFLIFISSVFFIFFFIDPRHLLYYFFLRLLFTSHTLHVSLVARLLLVIAGQRSI